MDSSLLIMGVLPIMVFLLIDSLASQKKALISALVMALGEVIFSLIRFGSIDYLTWIAFVTLSLFIGLSIYKQNDIFFKLQGPLISLVTALGIWGAYLFLNKSLLVDMTEKYFGINKLAEMNPHLNKETLRQMLYRINLHLPIWLVIHALLTIGAAFKTNKWVWAAIRVPGFYLILFVGMFIAVRL